MSAEAPARGGGPERRPGAAARGLLRRAGQLLSEFHPPPKHQIACLRPCARATPPLGNGIFEEGPPVSRCDAINLLVQWSAIAVTFKFSCFHNQEDDVFAADSYKINNPCLQAMISALKNCIKKIAYHLYPVVVDAVIGPQHFRADSTALFPPTGT